MRLTKTLQIIPKVFRGSFFRVCGQLPSSMGLAAAPLQVLMFASSRATRRASAKAFTVARKYAWAPGSAQRRMLTKLKPSTSQMPANIPPLTFASDWQKARGKRLGENQKSWPAHLSWFCCLEGQMVVARFVGCQSDLRAYKVPASPKPHQQQAESFDCRRVAQICLNSAGNGFKVT